MPCSPLLIGIADVTEILRIVHKHPILCFSEPPQTFRALEERGWVRYDLGRWCITEEGTRVLSTSVSESDDQQSLADFFGL